MNTLETMKYFEVIVPQLTPKRFAKWLYREVNALPPANLVVDKGEKQLLLENFVFKLTEPEDGEWGAHYLQIDAQTLRVVESVEMFDLIQGWDELIPTVIMIEMRDDAEQVHIIGECKDYMANYVRYLITRLKHVYPEARFIQTFPARAKSYITWWNENELSAELQGTKSALEELESERDKGMIDIGRYLRLKEAYETRKAKLLEEIGHFANAT